MDQGQFDDLARSVSRPLTRRGGLRGLAAAVVAVITGAATTDAARKATRRHEKLACRNVHSQCVSHDQCCSNNCAPVPPYEGTGFRCARGQRHRDNAKKKRGGSSDPCDLPCTVCPTCTYTNINAAVGNAAPGDVIRIAPGIYEEELNLDGGPSPLTLERCGCSGEVEWRGEPAGAPPSAPEPQGPGVRGIIVLNGPIDFTLRSIVLDGSPAFRTYNAQIGVTNDGQNDLSTFHAEDVTFRNMPNDSYSMAPLTIAGHVAATVEGCSFTNNHRDYYGAIYLEGAAEGASLTVTNSVFTGNSGNAVFYAAAAEVTFVGCTVTNNSATSSGTFALSSYVTATFDDCTITNNTTVSIGGGILVSATDEAPGAGVTLHLTGSTTVSGNNAANGGGLAVLGDYATITGAETRVTGNSPDQCVFSTNGSDWAVVAGCAY